MNIIIVLLGVCVLNNRLGLNLGLEEVLFAYSFKRHKLNRYYLVDNAQPLHLVTNLPNTSKIKPQGNVLVFGPWDYARDPMLRKFLVPSLASTSQ